MFLRRLLLCFVCMFFLLVSTGSATVLGQVRGLVRDPQHRTLPGVEVVLQAANSDFTLTVLSGPDGVFAFAPVALGDYTLTTRHAGFQTTSQSFTLASNTTQTLQIELSLDAVTTSVTVHGDSPILAPDSITPTTLVSRLAIEQTPGADRTNSLQMITAYVPGAYVTHDQLHVRGGHQVSWLIDGVQIPNTNIAGNLGAQIDPKDIEYLEVQRGSYAADLGDRTYGIFNVVPRSGFEGNRMGDVTLTAGNFRQAGAQISLGSHTEKSAYYASVNGNRSDYGLAPPIEQVHHDAANGYGGFASALYNRSRQDQFRAVAQWRGDFYQIPDDPDPASDGNQAFDTSGLRDAQREGDQFAIASWVHTFGASTVLQLSPFFHRNHAAYEPAQNDTPVASTSDRVSQYAGVQGSILAQAGPHTLEAGLYGFGQNDSYNISATSADPSIAPFASLDRTSGGIVEGFVSDLYRVTSWLTLSAGLRASTFQGSLAEDAWTPRLGASVVVPRLHWIFTGFYGRFYQPPPLLTFSQALQQFAQAQNATFQTLHGERDEEHQFGVQIPLSGWVLHADTFKTRAKNFLDHANIGESSLFYPVTIDGALIQAWELTLRSPQIAHRATAHLAYSNQVARQRGGLTGGLVCYPLGSPACSADFTYTPLDHDQHNTLNAGVESRLGKRLFAAVDLAYGSGFHNGSPDANYPADFLPQHTTVDLMLRRSFGEDTSVSVNLINAANQRVLLDNSLTFGGFHFADPRQIYAEVRYRFHY